MRARWTATTVVTATALVVLSASAEGRTLGSTQRPAGADEVRCPSIPNLVGIPAAEGDISWTAPARAVVGSWSTNVSEAAAGASMSLVVLRAAGDAMTIAAVDTATVPAQMPADGIATVKPDVPIVMEPGDRLAVAGGDGATCGWQHGSIPVEQQAAVGEAVPALAAGATVRETIAPEPAAQLNISADLVEQTDVRVTAAAGPRLVASGTLAQLTATITNAGAAPAPVSVTDAVPAGLRIETAVAGGGSCSVLGQQVTCAIPSLAPGASDPIVVVVTPSSAGGFVNTVTAMPPLEATPIDNTASATLTVADAELPVQGGGIRVVEPGVRAAGRRCVVPRLRGAPVAVARDVLSRLGCRPVVVRRPPSRTRIPRGL
ncbi:DUF11 domain-containing protein [Conexibacter sp. JD483]|uniref:DUF11 domain-containing protein n=1 Tax=unclassified Conexibacter TaxID=2627773 RepID=UPI002720F8EB|nr:MULTISPECIES: DUF11 domain-containing protein [unclassified Conexibacter]MDO8189033.1 DUF11 domain-containing protein [Conexibacter sp. CPCC 205706]MDO8198526.1 DUF11 domain-containing protein [Conexibacter sp. CPCC 205762]MDR9367612.1 DUF11 domain-containing protein [Conexibacter sp. JD483]